MTLTGWGVFLLGLANGWRAVGLGRQSSLLLELGVTPDPRLRLVMASLWAILFVIAAVALWRRRRAARLLIPLLLLLYGIYQLAPLALFARVAESRSAWQASAVLYSAATLYSGWALNRGVGRSYFQDALVLR